jgi:hypothetical protein
VASPSPDAPPVMTAEMVESSFMGLFLNGGFRCIPRRYNDRAISIRMISFEPP